MKSETSRALYLALLLVALFVGVLGADRLGLTAIAVLLLTLGVGTELFFWVTLVQGDGGCQAGKTRFW